MVDVFISYSRANQDVVRHLAEAATRLGYDVWWDDELPPHRSYSEVITEKIGEAKAAIVVWSGGSIGSEWVRAEADLARHQKKLIQTAIDDCMPPMPFNQIQFASLAGWAGEDDHPGWNKVKGSLAALCGAPAGPGPAYPLPETPPPVAPAPQPPVAAAAPTPVRPAPRRSNLLLGALIGGSIAVIAGVGLLALGRGGGQPDAAVVQPQAGNAARPDLPDGDVLGDRPPAPDRPAGPPAAAQALPAQRTPAPRQVRPTPARQPQRASQAMPMGLRKWCMGPGRGTPRCMEMRRRRAAY